MIEKKNSKDSCDSVDIATALIIMAAGQSSGSNHSDFYDRFKSKIDH